MGTTKDTTKGIAEVIQNKNILCTYVQYISILCLYFIGIIYSLVIIYVIGIIYVLIIILLYFIHHIVIYIISIYHTLKFYC